MNTPMSKGTILLIDDDPDHLRIYGWIVEKAGFSPVPCLVAQGDVKLPADQAVDLVVLDYTLNCGIPTPQIAQMVMATYPGVPIVLLSQVDGLPCDMEPYVSVFVRKGEPQKLTEAVRNLLSSDSDFERNR